MRAEILGQERRRRWGDAKRHDVVMSIGLHGAAVTEVAIGTSILGGIAAPRMSIVGLQPRNTACGQALPARAR